MTYGPEPLGATPIAAIDTSALTGKPTLINRLRRGDSAPIVNFVEIFAKTLTGTAGLRVDPIGAVPIAALPVEAIGVTAGETLFFSDREWCGKPDDAKRPNQLARAALLSAGDYQTRAPIFPEEARRS
ncbi:MAG: hypothetical protein AB7P23_01830, partial [Amphiplicatus sp.]